VTESLVDYEAQALALAHDPARLLALKKKLAQKRSTAPLFDADDFRRGIEAAYLTMWERRGEAPRSFSVESAR